MVEWFWTITLGQVNDPHLSLTFMVGLFCVHKLKSNLCRRGEYDFGPEVDTAFEEGALEKVWVKSDDGWDADKTTVIVLDHYFLDGFGGKLGVKWF